MNTHINWYCNISASVRWADVLSQQFGGCCGVREGSIISPLMFNIYINDLDSLLKSEGCGCYLGNFSVGCLLFADNIMLLFYP